MTGSAPCTALSSRGRRSRSPPPCRARRERPPLCRSSLGTADRRGGCECRARGIADTVRPPGGAIYRSPNGCPTGAPCRSLACGRPSTFACPGLACAPPSLPFSGPRRSSFFVPSCVSMRSAHAGRRVVRHPLRTALGLARPMRVAVPAAQPATRLRLPFAAYRRAWSDGARPVLRSQQVALGAPLGLAVTRLPTLGAAAGTLRAPPAPARAVLRRQRPTARLRSAAREADGPPAHSRPSAPRLAATSDRNDAALVVSGSFSEADGMTAARTRSRSSATSAH
jgi:hypothetical protein